MASGSGSGGGDLNPFGIRNQEHALGDNVANAPGGVGAGGLQAPGVGAAIGGVGRIEAGPGGEAAAGAELNAPAAGVGLGIAAGRAGVNAPAAGVGLGAAAVGTELNAPAAGVGLGAAAVGAELNAPAAGVGLGAAAGGVGLPPVELNAPAAGVGLPPVVVGVDAGVGPVVIGAVAGGVRARDEEMYNADLPVHRQRIRRINGENAEQRRRRLEWNRQFQEFFGDSDSDDDD